MDSTSINLENAEKIDVIKLHKMAFIYNALEKGWNVKKNGDCYIFTKNHSGKKEVFLDTYLKKFIQNNLNIDNLQ
tara:strand:- start:2110 stop:2334 length:225 start_codon:yes stop_codon:yes gene_type:complete